MTIPTANDPFASGADFAGTSLKRVCRRLIIALVFVGMALRLEPYLLRPSYWNDEAAIVMNVQDRSARELIKPLSYAQAAPPLFLWAERGLFKCFGIGELGMRSLPVLLGLLSVPLFGLLAWRVLPAESAFWAVAFFCLSYKLIAHVNMVKQYSGDVFISVLLLCAAFAYEKTQSSARRLAITSVITAVALWYSFPAVFLFGAISLVLLPGVWRESRSKLAGAAKWLVLNVLPVVSFLAMDRLVLRQGHDKYLETFWAPNFVDWHRPITWLLTKQPTQDRPPLKQLLDYPLASLGEFLLLVSMIGAFSLFRNGRGRIAGVLFWALLLNLIASAMHRYPLAGQRLSLYLFPIAFLVLGAGAEWKFLFRQSRWLPLVGIALAAPLLGLSILQTVDHAIHPEFLSWIRPIAADVRSAHHDGEPIYLVADASPDRDRISGTNVEFLCYWRNPPGDVRYKLPKTTDAMGMSGRFWVVTSTPKAKDSFKAIQRVRQAIDPWAVEIMSFTQGGASAMLCQRREGAASR